MALNSFLSESSQWCKTRVLTCPLRGVIIALTWMWSQQLMCPSAVAEVGDYPKFEGYVLESHSRIDSISGSYSYRSRRGPSFLRLRRSSNLDAESASTIIKNEILAIQAQYSGAVAPYPDAISNSIELDRSLIPNLEDATIKGVPLKFCTTYLSLSKAHGVQSVKDAIYKGVLAWAYCANQREARTIEVIVPISHFSEKYKKFVLENICSSSN